MTGEERKRYDDDVKFRNAVCEHGSQRRKCNTCDLLCEQHDNAALRARIKEVEGMADALQANLRIFIHAHETGNSVPTFVVKDAEECCRRAKEG